PSVEWSTAASRRTAAAGPSVASGTAAGAKACILIHVNLLIQGAANQLRYLRLDYIHRTINGLVAGSHANVLVADRRVVGAEVGVGSRSRRTAGRVPGIAAVATASLEGERIADVAARLAGNGAG